MCTRRSFLYFFSIRAGAGFVSAMYLFLGLLGCLLTSLLPYSVNHTQLVLVFLYNLLLVAGFGISLSGILNYNRLSLRFGNFLVVLAFLAWLALTIPTLASFSHLLDARSCFGAQCGETHWLVPRNWDKNDFNDRPAPKGKGDIFFDDYFNMDKKPPFPDYQIVNPESRSEASSILRSGPAAKEDVNIKELRSSNPKPHNQRMKIGVRKEKIGNGFEERLKRINKTSKVRINEGKKLHSDYSKPNEGKKLHSDYSKPSAGEDYEEGHLEKLMEEIMPGGSQQKRTPVLSTERGLMTLIRERRDIIQDLRASSLFKMWDHDPRFAGIKFATMRLTHNFSIALALLYALCFLCGIIILCLNNFNFNKEMKECFRDCQPICE